MMPRPTIYYNDNDAAVCEWIRQLMFDGLIPYGVVDSRSILDVKPADLEGFTQCHFFCGIAGWAYALKLAGWPATRPVWTGSPPCQPFSAAGKLEGKDDARHLAPHFISLVGACRPPVLFGEQVASAAVFGKFAKRVGGEPEWAWLDDLSDRLEAAHYAVGASDIPAAGVSAPHIRQRTFFGAVRLADTNYTGRETQRNGAIRTGPSDEAGLRGATERLANAERGERGSNSLQGLRQADGAESCGASNKPARDCDGGGLADAQCVRTEDGAGNSKKAHEVSQGECEPVVSSNVFERGSAGGGGHRNMDGTRAPNHTGPGGTDHGGWDDVDWLFCRDGKWRPVKSSVQRVADGLPRSVVQGGDIVPASQPLAQSTKEARRVMRLRGYGNAIVPQAAALFIKAFDAVLTQQAITSNSTAKESEICQNE